MHSSENLLEVIVNILCYWPWLGCDSVDIFMQSLQKLPQKLLGIVLLVTREGRGKPLYLGLEWSSVECPAGVPSFTPHITQQVGKCCKLIKSIIGDGGYS